MLLSVSVAVHRAPNNPAHRAGPPRVKEEENVYHSCGEHNFFFLSQINTYDSSVFCKLAQRRKAESRKRKVCLQTSGINMALDYPFLNDSTSRSLIWRSKVLFIMRGLPGSGKSTIVRAIAQSYQRSVVCSADDYFFKDGVYKFDAACLSSAHESCQNKAKDSCNAGIPVVIVDNTNVRRWEMKFYLELASHRDYVVVPVQPKTAWRWNPVELAAKNKHGVDVETLKRKVCLRSKEKLEECNFIWCIVY